MVYWHASIKLRKSGEFGGSGDSLGNISALRPTDLVPHPLLAKGKTTTPLLSPEGFQQLPGLR
jgi:hypothetical protein